MDFGGDGGNPTRIVQFRRLTLYALSYVPKNSAVLKRVASTSALWLAFSCRRVFSPVAPLFPVHRQPSRLPSKFGERVGSQTQTVALGMRCSFRLSYTPETWWAGRYLSVPALSPRTIEDYETWWVYRDSNSDSFLKGEVFYTLNYRPKIGFRGRA